MSALTGSVKKCQTQSLAFPDSVSLWCNKAVGAKVARNYKDQAVF
jgi:hypothetical protein